MLVNNRKLSLLGLFVFLFASTVQAIDVGVTNALINPSIITGSSNYTISVDITNRDDQAPIPSGTPEDAVFLAVSISGFNPVNVNFTGSPIVTNTAGWTCNADVNSNSIDCSRSFSPSEFPPGTGLSSIQPFSITLTPTASPFNSDNFTISVSEEGGAVEDFSTDNQTNVATLAPEPEYSMSVTENGAQVLTQDIELNTVTSTYSFELENYGSGASTFGEFLAINSDMNSGFNISQPTVTPIVNNSGSSWNCTAVTSGYECSNNNMLEGLAVGDRIVFSGTITSFPSSQGAYPSAVTADIFTSDSNFSDNTAHYDITMVQAQTDLLVTKFAKDAQPTGSLISSIDAGTSFYYHIHVDNISNTDATGVSIVDNVPAGLQVLNNLSTGGWGCTISPFVNQLTSQSVSCTYAGTIPANSNPFSDIIILEVQGLTPGTYNNQTENVVSNELDSNASNNQNNLTQANITVNLIPSLTVSKTIDSGVVSGAAEQGSQVVYKILVENTVVGSNATNVIISDTLPAGITYSSHNLLGSFASCDVLSLPLITCTSTSLPSNAIEHGVEIVVDVVGAVGASVTNSVSVSALNATDVAASAPAFVVELPYVDIAVLKEAEDVNGLSQTSFVVNEDFHYKITIQNNSSIPVPIDHVVVSDTIPSELTINAINTFPNSPDWNCTNDSGQLISCKSINAIAASGSSDIYVSVHGSALASNIINTASATVFSDGPDLVQENPLDFLNNSSSSTPVDIVSIALPEVDLNILKEAEDISGFSQTSFNVNEDFNYKMTVHNTGANDAGIGDVTVTDSIPAELLINTDPSNTDWDCSATVGNNLSCTNLVIIPASVGFLDLFVSVQGSAPATNVINSASVGLEVGASVQENAANLSDNNINSNPIDILPVFTSLTANKIAVYNSQSVTSVPRSASFEYQINITNSGSSNAVNIQVQDIMPTEVTVNGFSGAGWICNNSAQLYNCDFAGPLLGGEVTTLSFDVTDVSALSVSQIQNDVEVSADNASLVTASHTLNVVDLGAMVQISQTPEPSLEGMPFDISIDVTNTGTTTLSSVSVLNTLPAGFSYGALKSSLIKGGVVTSTCNTSAQDLTCTFDGPILVGNTETIVVPVIGIQTVNPAITYTNVTTVSAAGLNPDIIINTDLSVVSSSAPSYNLNLVNFTNPVEVGQQYNYFMIVENTGLTTITNMHIDFDLTSNLIVHSISSNSFNCTSAASLVNCNSNPNLSIASGANNNLITLSVSSPSYIGDLTANANANIGGAFPVSTSQTTTVVTSSVDDIDVSLQKTASIDTVLANSPFTYSLTVLNNSTVNATDVTIIDNLPNGVTLGSINANDWTCSGTVNIICSTNEILANSSKSIDLEVTAPNNLGAFTNTAVVSVAENDINPSNNSSSAVVEVVSVLPGADADIKVSKLASSTNVTSGDMFDWVIEVENLGPGIASNIIVEDMFPSGFELVSVAADTNTNCQSTNTTMNCQITLQEVHEVNTITVTGKATLASGSLENTVNVSSQTQDPDLDNNISTAEIMVDELIIPEADLSVSITQGESIQQGKSTSFEVSVLNTGPDTAVHPILDLAISGLVETATVNSSAWSCQVNGLNLSCSLNSGSLGVNQQTLLTLNVLTQEIVSVAEDLILTATTGSDTLDPETSNNTATNSISVVPTPTEGEILDRMRTALGGSAGPVVDRAIESVSSYCERRYFTALEGLCDDLYNVAVEGDGETLSEFMKEVAPTEVVGQSSSAAEIMTAQFRNIDARLSQLRGGGGGFSMAGLNARYGDGSIPLGMLAYLNQTDSETDGVSQPSSDFVSPWGFFMNGTISMGERDPTTRELGFDFDTYGVTAGIDYRLDAKKVIGLALGYASFDSEIDDKSAKMESSGVTLTAYGSFYINDNFYVDSRISYGKPDFEQERKIDVSVGNTHIQRTSKGSTDANQYTVAMGLGYHFNKKSWNITPNASFRYVRTKINGFAENGAGAFDFVFGDQEIESLVWSAGVSVSKAISLKNGVITPQFDFNYNYESENDGGFIEARFIQAPVDEIFIIETDSPDSTYGSAGVGLVYVTSNGRQAYINYRSVLGLQGFSRGTINLGARFEF